MQIFRGNSDPVRQVPDCQGVRCVVLQENTPRQTVGSSGVTPRGTEPPQNFDFSLFDAAQCRLGRRYSRGDAVGISSIRFWQRHLQKQSGQPIFENRMPLEAEFIHGR